MKLIESKTLTTAQTAIEFTSIPQDGTDLLVLCSVRSGSSFVGAVRVLVNGNAGSSRYLEGTGSAVGNNATSSIFGFTSSGTNTANTFGNVSFYFPNYALSAAKSVSIESVAESNATSAYSSIVAGSVSTTAITSLTFNDNAETFVAGSTISLYKITKGSDGIVTTSP
jgi:hypothetical protein